jgi:hypothetical protein
MGSRKLTDSDNTSSESEATFLGHFITFLRFVATPVFTAGWVFYFAYQNSPKTQVMYLAISAAIQGALMFVIRPFKPVRDRAWNVILYLLLDMLVFPLCSGRLLRGLSLDQLVIALISLATLYASVRFSVISLDRRLEKKKGERPLGAGQAAGPEEKPDEEDNSWTYSDKDT